MKENWLDGFAQTVEDAIYRQVFRGSDDEIVSVIYDSIQILYKNAPLKPFIFKKRLIEHPEQLNIYKEMAKDGTDDIPTMKSLQKQLLLPGKEDKNKKVSIQKPQFNLPKHWTMEEILRWAKHKPKKKQTWFLIVHLPAGTNYADFKAKESYFATAIGGSCEIERVGAAVYMTISNIQLERKYNFNFDPRPYMKKMQLPILLGYTISGAVVVDLAELITILTGGLKGSGKSVLFHGAIYTLLQLNAILNRTHVLVAIIDPKIKEFRYFKEYGATWVHEIDEARQLLELLDEINTKRQNLIGGHANNILEWNALGNQLPHIVLFVDEIADMASDPTCKELLYKAVRKYRSQGIYVWAATQRPSAKTWGNQNEFSEFKSQFEARISFRMADPVNSQIILDSDKAAYLPIIPGRAIFKYPTEQEIQCSYFPSKAKNPELFYNLMSQLPKVALQYEDIKGTVHEDECYYPRKRSQTGFESSQSLRNFKMLESGSNPHS